MKIILELSSGLMAALLISFLIMQPLRKLAKRVGLVDRPNHRKVHVASVPLVGGIAIAASNLIAMALIPFSGRYEGSTMLLLTPALLLLLVGVIDDRFEVRPILRLGVQAVCALGLAMGGVRITDLHGLFGFGPIPMLPQYAITVLLITGVVNAFNLIDGIDGFAGIMGAFGALVLGTIAFVIGQFGIAFLHAALLGGILGFLRFNLGTRAKVFLGDAGSLFLGMLLIGSAVKLWQVLPVAMATDFPLIRWAITAIFWVPVLDALRVFLYRKLSGMSPLVADRTHIHHMALQLGRTHKNALKIILIMSLILLCVCGIITQKYTVTLGWIIGIVLYKVFTSMLRLNREMELWQERLRGQELGASQETVSPVGLQNMS